jgi:YidC/Oxa1 family membrane protein insertase
MRMSSRARKFVVTATLVAIVVSIGGLVMRGGGVRPPATGNAANQPAPTTPAPTATPTPSPTTPQDPNAAATPAAAPTPPAAGALTARVPDGFEPVAEPMPIGSIDPAVAPFKIEFTAKGAGVSRIVFADYWKTVDASRDARKARDAGDAASMPADDLRYVIGETRKLQGYDVPALALRVAEVDGRFVDIYSGMWAEVPGRAGSFVTEIADEAGDAVLRLTRTFTPVATDPTNRYLLGVSHTIENLDDAPHTVRLVQYGPSDPAYDAKTLVEARRLHFGYLYPIERDPAQQFVTANGQMFERGDVVKRLSAGENMLWPNQSARESKLGLVWYGVTDRYFAFAVHASAPDATAWTAPQSKLLGSVAEVRGIWNGELSPNDAIITELWSPVTSVEAGRAATLAMGVYAGPLDPKALEGVEPYSSLNLGDLIVYVMAGCCSWCTFGWLSDFLLWFLTFIHDYLVFDWGLAIIVLVIVVRLILHPVQKKSMISMQRFSRAMTAMKPELDALQKKFKDDPRRMQQEQMRLFREKGVSPAGCVGGMLPTFAQMPIWMALYAVLYFAFPLRHQAPFFGVFQSFGDWAFLADLSAQDNFIQFAEPINLFLFNLSSINLLPILMGIVFWFQQQYMTPPTPNMSEEQLAQQKMMKWMMVLMFPIMMYVVPSGLTLYILTSTCIGIVEGRIIKKQVDAMDLTVKPTERKKKDFLGRMYEEALKRAEQRQQPQKKYKER